MPSSLQDGLGVEVQDRVITIWDKNRNCGKFLIEFEYDLNDYLVEEILDRCKEDLLMDYPEKTVNENLLPNICNELAVTYYVNECEQFRVGHDGTIYINEGYLTLESKYHVATDICPFLNLTEIDMVCKLSKLLLHINNFDTFIEPFELKHMYESADKAFHAMQKRRLARLTVVLNITLEMISKIVQVAGDKAKSTTEMNTIRNLVRDYVESNKGLPIGLDYIATNDIEEMDLFEKKEWEKK